MREYITLDNSALLLDPSNEIKKSLEIGVDMGDQSTTHLSLRILKSSKGKIITLLVLGDK